jgi:RNA 2',3'-cyclic 3'-phosphodiesterase
MKPRKFTDRLFLAAELPRFARERIMESRKKWRKQLTGDVRWIPPLNLFLQLRYLGELERGTSKKLSARLEELCASTPAIQLAVDGIGVSPNSSEATQIWLGLEESAELTNLRNSIEDGCRSLKIGNDKKAFQHRINLSKTSEPQAIPELHIKQMLKGFKLKNIALMESRTGQNGPSYHTLRKFSLKQD